MRWLAGALAILGILAVLFIGLKIGGEMRYRNCLQRVELEYPVAFATPHGQFSAIEESRFEFFQPPNREIALKECHGWP